MFYVKMLDAYGLAVQIYCGNERDSLKVFREWHSTFPGKIQLFWNTTKLV